MSKQTEVVTCELKSTNFLGCAWLYKNNFLVTWSKMYVCFKNTDKIIKISKSFRLCILRKYWCYFHSYSLQYKVKQPISWSFYNFLASKNFSNSNQSIGIVKYNLNVDEVVRISRKNFLKDRPCNVQSISHEIHWWYTHLLLTLLKLLFLTSLLCYIEYWSS